MCVEAVLLHSFEQKLLVCSSFLQLVNVLNLVEEVHCTKYKIALVFRVCMHLITVS